MYRSSVCLLLWLLVSLFAPISVTAAQDEFNFVQLCDPQLGMTDYKEDICSLEQAVKQINILNPCFVIVCGDMVHSPSQTALSDFTKIMEHLAVPCYYVPGNHDVPPSTNSSALTRYRELFGKDYYTFTKGAYRFVMCNTQLLRSPVQTAVESQIMWIEQELKLGKESGMIPVMVGHHPPFYKSAVEADAWQNLPTSQRRELLTLCDTYHVQAYLSGHTHHFLANRYNEMNIISGESTSTNIDGHVLGFRLWKAGKSQLMGHTFIPLYKRNQINPKPSYDPDLETGVVARCLANLRLLDTAKEIVAMKRQMPNGAVIPEEELYQRVREGRASLVCPGGGTYRINPLGTDPECSCPAHGLPYFYQYEEFRKRAKIQKQLREKIFDDPPPAEISNKEG